MFFKMPVFSQFITQNRRMYIIVNEASGKNIHLRLPSGLLLNGLSATLLSFMLKEVHLNISSKQLCILFQAIKIYKQNHPKWKLVEVYGHDGESVEIVL